MLLRRLAVALAVAGAIAVPAAHAPSACAASAHHAALIIDTGDQVVRRCVGFDEDSITGKDVLDRANVDPVYSDKYSDAFICSLLGVGNDQAHCPNSDPAKNWVYWEAKSGDPTFTKPGQAASRTDVHDGDVEGWTWANATPPPYSSTASVCPASTPPPPPPPPPAASPPPPPASGTTVVPSSGAAKSGGTNTSSTTPGDTTSSTAADSTTSTPTTSGSLALRESRDDGGKGGSPWALAAVGVIVAGLGTASVVISRRRRVGG